MFQGDSDVNTVPTVGRGPAPRASATELRRITLRRIEVPLKKEITHASHSRDRSENLVVEVELATGHIGYGEGVPRSYVTGETVETAFVALSRPDWARLLGKPHDFADVVQSLQRLQLAEIEEDPRGMFGNAARCGLELALLDAYGRCFGESAGRAIELIELPGLDRFSTPRPVRYGAAITAESLPNEIRSAIRFRLYGFRDVKAKVGVEHQDDARRLRWIRGILGKGIDLRLDANEAWGAADLLEKVEPLRRFSPSCLEQPIPHAQVDALAELRPRLRIPVMLDESLCGYPDAVAAIERGTADLLNVRVSKCGGIFPSLRIIALAARSGLGVQLGCHPGETAILSAAGRMLASRVRGLRYVEGSYDRHILRRNLSREDLTFGYGGRAQPLPGPGLGATVDPSALEAMTTEKRELAYD